MYVARNRDSLTVTQAQSDFDSWTTHIRTDVDKVLDRFFESKSDEARELSRHAIDLVREVRDLTMRGGKRLRPIVTSAAYRAVTGEQSVKETYAVGAALELLQTYLLIHDDWMDEDNERRGGPAVHFSFQQEHDNDHLGASLGILAGDLASTFSWELFLQGVFPESRRQDALQMFVQIQKEVFAGQQLDLMADAEVERMHRLKTGSYTTQGPAALGALLGDASEDQLNALSQWAEPLGVAFQLRDDLLSTFGAAQQTGKPGDDLRHGKHNAVIAAFQKLPEDPDASRAVNHVWGNADATETELAAARSALESAGAKSSVEARLAELSDASMSALEASAFADDAKAILSEVTHRLTHRGN